LGGGSETLIAKCLTSKNQRLDVEMETFVVGTLAASGAGTSRPAGQGNELDFLIPVKTNCTSTYALAENTIGRQPQNCGNGDGFSNDLMYTLNATGVHGVAHQFVVRRLTTTECERLQGFPDDYTRIPYRNKPAEDCPDGPRYKALGNSMAVPCMRWIGERIAMTENREKM
jgi:site-specific DNA-cytosine methylase